MGKIVVKYDFGSDQEGKEYFTSTTNLIAEVHDECSCPVLYIKEDSKIIASFRNWLYWRKLPDNR